MKKVILLIEDNQDVRENTAEILALAGYDVETAINGKEGVAKALQRKPDLIVCDIMMPELDGYGVLFMLSKNPATSGIPFIFLTAKAEKTDFRKGMSLGADDYLTKPFDEMELLNTIELRLKKSDALKVAASGEHALDKLAEQSGGLDELEKLRLGRTVRRLKKKEPLYHEGDHCAYLYYVNSGRVKTFKTNHEGKEYVTDIHGAGEYLSYVSILKDSEHTESAVALENAEVTLINRQAFLDLIHKNRDVAARFINVLSKQVAEVEKGLLELAYNSVRKRVADALLTLDEKFNHDFIQISREDLAALVGTSRETGIRMLSEFKDEDAIELGNNRIKVLKPELLRRSYY